MITKCICYNITFEEILKLSSIENICNKCKMCNPYIKESIKTGMTKFPVDYFKNYDILKKDELES